MRATKAHEEPVVLLAQPERDDRDMYAEFLRYKGFAPIPVSTARDALILAPQVAIIVTGMLLPGHIEGLEFGPRVRRRRSLR